MPVVLHTLHVLASDTAYVDFFHISQHLFYVKYSSYPFSLSSNILSCSGLICTRMYVVCISGFYLSNGTHSSQQYLKLRWPDGGRVTMVQKHWKNTFCLVQTPKTKTSFWNYGNQHIALQSRDFICLNKIISVEFINIHLSMFFLSSWHWLHVSIVSFLHSQWKSWFE